MFMIFVVVFMSRNKRITRLLINCFCCCCKQRANSWLEANYPDANGTVIPEELNDSVNVNLNETIKPETSSKLP